MKRNIGRRLTGILLAIVLLGFCLPGRVVSAEGASSQTAVYLGVYHYGKKGVDIAHANDLRYRFSVNGTEVVYAIAGGADYPIQNTLKEGGTYLISVSGQTVVSAKSTQPELVAAPTSLVTNGTPGRRTLRNLLTTAMMPVGQTLYVYGGGWNWQDTGAGRTARTIGIPYDWQSFYQAHYRGYHYKDGTEASFYPYGGFNEYGYEGLDCSGYLGWTLYNTFETTNGNPGYVYKSTAFAKNLAARGWGTFTQSVNTKGEEMKPGDIMSMNGHVWLSLGTCTDGSVLIAHSTPSDNRYGQPGGGVQLSAIGRSSACEAYRLADSYMTARCPGWHEYYPTQLFAPEAFFAFRGEEAGKFMWDVTGVNGGLTDPEGIRNMEPQEVLSTVLSR